MAPEARLVRDPQPSVVPNLQLHDIGPLAVEVNGALAAIPGVKPTRILSTLLVHANRRVSVDTLLDAVWGDGGAGSAGGTLESHIWRLRKVLEPQRARRAEPTYLINDAGGYRLIVNPDNADSLRFAQLAQQGDRLLASDDAERALARYEFALTLWRGRPFDPVADEEWAAAPIARLQEVYEFLNEQRIEALLRTGAADRAIGELEALIAQLPYRERLWQQLMLGLYRSGRVEEALNAYHRARETLLDTMGVEPGAELSTLQQRILDQDPALVPNRPNATAELAGATTGNHEIHLPSRLSALIGRAAELEHISRLLQRSRLVTLVGTAGCGKTRLAIEVARAASTLAPDGVWFIDLATIEDPDAVLDLALSTIGLEQPPLGTAVTALRSYVRDRQLLLLVDNCEHVLPGVNQLLDVMLEVDSQCRVLATSREPLGLDGEVLWTLAPLPVHDGTALTAGEPSPSAQLFLDRARSADPLFELTVAGLVDVEAICAAVDGIPLAIELAAGRIRAATLGEVQHQVVTELGALSRAGYARTEHHRTVELSIDWSVRLLPEAERAVHARLSALPGIFTVQAARAVAGADPAAASEVPELLNQLAHRSLLMVVPGDSGGQPTRFRQLATVRAHAARALSGAGQSEDAKDRRAAFVVELVAALPPPGTEDRHGGYTQVELNHDTLAAVLHDTVYDRPDPLAVRLVGHLGAYWYYRRRVAEGVRWAQGALDRSQAPAADRVATELTLAYLLVLRDRTDLAVPLVHGALAHAQVGAGADSSLLANLLSAAGWAAFLRGHQALDFVSGEVRRLSRGAANIDVLAEALEAALLLAAQGPVVASSRASEALDRALDLGNMQAAWYAAALDMICAVQTGDTVRGRARLRQFADYQRRTGAVVTGNVVEFEAVFAAIAGEHERAAQLFGHASALAFRTGAPWPTVTVTQSILAQLRRDLARETFDAAWQAGHTQTD